MIVHSSTTKYNSQQQQFEKITLNEAISRYKHGLITVRGLLLSYVNIKLKPGWGFNTTPRNISTELGIGLSSFYKAFKWLAKEGYVENNLSDKTFKLSRPLNKKDEKEKVSAIANSNVPNSDNSISPQRLDSLVRESNSLIVESNSQLVERKPSKHLADKSHSPSTDSSQIFFKTNRLKREENNCSLEKKSQNELHELLDDEGWPLIEAHTEVDEIIEVPEKKIKRPLNKPDKPSRPIKKFDIGDDEFCSETIKAKTQVEKLGITWEDVRSDVKKYLERFDSAIAALKEARPENKVGFLKAALRGGYKPNKPGKKTQVDIDQNIRERESSNDKWWDELGNLWENRDTFLSRRGYIVEFIDGSADSITALVKDFTPSNFLAWFKDKYQEFLSDLTEKPCERGGTNHLQEGQGQLALFEKEDFTTFVPADNYWEQGL